MYATEKGYYTGTAAESVSQATFAKYIPRMFADDLVAGITRTYSYQLVDQTTDPTQGFSNGGLIAVNGNGTLSPKPAYYTLQHMIQLLSDSGTLSSTLPLYYSLSYTPPAGYTTANPNYWGIPPTIQHLLLQKSNGTYELLVWNDVSSAAIADGNGTALTSTARDIRVPLFPVTLTFATPVQTSATLYGLNPYGNTSATTLDTTAENIVGGSLALNVPDYVGFCNSPPCASLGMGTSAVNGTPAPAIGRTRQCMWPMSPGVLHEHRGRSALQCRSRRGNRQARLGYRQQFHRRLHHRQWNNCRQHRWADGVD